LPAVIGESKVSLSADDLIILLEKSFKIFSYHNAAAISPTHRLTRDLAHAGRFHFYVLVPPSSTVRVHVQSPQDRCQCAVAKVNALLLISIRYDSHDIQLLFKTWLHSSLATTGRVDAVSF
jgi:hypothetical protein